MISFGAMLGKKKEDSNETRQKQIKSLLNGFQTIKGNFTSRKKYKSKMKRC